jgi:predicted nucleic acid-binding protein
VKVISNTTVLSNFASIGSLELLRRLHLELSISVEVFQEIQNGLEEGYSFYQEVLEALSPGAKDGWIQLTTLSGEEEIELFLGMPGTLHQGEASSLAIARARGWLLLTDDKAARKAALQREIPISGTLGCLVGAVESGLCSLSEANLLLEQIVEEGFFSPVSDLSALIDQR